MNEPTVWFERWANEMCLGETDWCLQNVWFCLLLFWNSNLRFKSMIRKIFQVVQSSQQIVDKERGWCNSPAVTHHHQREDRSIPFYGDWQVEAGKVSWLAAALRLLQRLSTYNQHWPNPTQAGHVCLCLQSDNQNVHKSGLDTLCLHTQGTLATQVNVPAILHLSVYRMY